MPSTKKSTLTVQKPFPLLRLPPEVRNRIWRYVVVKDEDVLIRPHKRQRLVQDLVPSRLRSGREIQGHKEDDDWSMSSTSLALAFSSRQLYVEVALIFYSENTVHFQYPRCLDRADSSFNRADSMLERFTGAIGPQNASSITAASFDDICCLCQNLSVLPGLKQVTVNGPLYPPPTYFNDFWPSQLRAYAQSHLSLVTKHLGKDWRLQE
ncbi:MAG: hypothetical protein Q9161_006004 [Pseudevernia consocians]